MADQPIAPIHPPEFPAPNFPTVFCDGVQSLANSATVVKLFLSRFDPDMWGGGDSRMQPIAQVVMPMEAFIVTAAFFDQRIKLWLEQGLIRQDYVDQVRRTAGL